MYKKKNESLNRQNTLNVHVVQGRYLLRFVIYRASDIKFVWESK